MRIAADPAFAGRRAVLVDLLGFGFSDRPEDFDYTIEGHSATIIGLLDELGIRGCDLIGHSSGGSIAIVLASQRPDLVTSLVLAEANLDPGMGPFSGRILAQSEEEYVNAGFRLALDELRTASSTDRVAAITLGMFQMSSPRAIYRTSCSLVGERTPTYREMLVALDVRRSFLVGSRTLDLVERPASGEDGEGLDRFGVERLVVSDAGHLMPLENPRSFADALSQALKG